jgi:periplasmic protein TonB
MIFNRLLLFFALSFSTVGCSQKVYTVVDIQPEYPNGLVMLYKYLGQNIKYPQNCRDNGIEGTLYIGFIIEKDGSITNVVCKRGHFCEDYTKNTIELIQAMPKWKPGLIKGKPVRVSYTIPIKIHLE